MDDAFVHVTLFQLMFVFVECMIKTRIIKWIFMAMAREKKAIRYGVEHEVYGDMFFV